MVFKTSPLAPATMLRARTVPVVCKKISSIKICNCLLISFNWIFYFDMNCQVKYCVKFQIEILDNYEVATLSSRTIKIRLEYRCIIQFAKYFTKIILILMTSFSCFHLVVNDWKLEQKLASFFLLFVTIQKSKDTLPKITHNYVSTACTI